MEKTERNALGYYDCACQVLLWYVVISGDG